MRATGKGPATTSSHTPPVSGESWNATASSPSGASCTWSIRRTRLWTSPTRFTKPGPCSTECSLSFAATTAPQQLSLDEGMIPTKNRLAIKQYIRDKPVRWGIKSFLLCEARNLHGPGQGPPLASPRISRQCCPPSRGELAGHQQEPHAVHITVARCRLAGGPPYHKTGADPRVAPYSMFWYNAHLRKQRPSSPPVLGGEETYWEGRRDASSPTVFKSAMRRAQARAPGRARRRARARRGGRGRARHGLGWEGRTNPPERGIPIQAVII